MPIGLAAKKKGEGTSRRTLFHERGPRSADNQSYYTK